MEEIWKKEGSGISSSEVARLTQEAVEKAESAETPLSDSLGEYGGYAKDRFPLTNDDTLREDFAKKILVEGYDSVEQSSNSNRRGEEVQFRMNEQANEKYQDIKKSAEVLNNKVAESNNLARKLRKLHDMVRILELHADLNPRFRLEKSNATREESAALATKEVSALLEEITRLQGELSKDDASVADLEREYNEKLSRYAALNAAWYPENPELN